MRDMIALAKGFTDSFEDEDITLEEYAQIRDYMETEAMRIDCIDYVAVAFHAGFMLGAEYGEKNKARE